jgi:hypothetical protein
MAAGELMPGPTLGSDASAGVPHWLAWCRHLVAVTVGLPELLLDAGGLLQRLGAAGVQIDILVAAASEEQADDAAALALGELSIADVTRHRLALPAPFGTERVDDLVAAMSELVGFDPEPGVFCLAPVTEGRQPCQVTVGAAADVIADAYGLPIVRYSETADEAGADVELSDDEWTRKCASLLACATAVLPLSGHREFFTVRSASARSAR